MSACAVMLVKDEEDIIEHVVGYLCRNVDEVIVADNLSTDKTPDILRDMQKQGLPIQIRQDDEVGYYQDRKTTALALEAFERGHRWVVPCDADEWWHSNDLRRLGDFLAGLGPEVQVVKAEVFLHLPSMEDNAHERNPAKRIGWRKRHHNMLKVACRARPDLQIHMGNHSCQMQGSMLTVGGLSVRHYPHRSEEQYVRKIRNGSKAYAATDLDKNFGVGWRMWDDVDDDTLRAHFREWFFLSTPALDPDVILDPAPGA